MREMREMMQTVQFILLMLVGICWLVDLLLQMARRSEWARQERERMDAIINEDKER